MKTHTLCTLAVATLSLLSNIAQADTLSNNLVRLTFDARGRVAAIVENATGRALVKSPNPFVVAQFADKPTSSVSPTGFVQKDNRLEFTFKGHEGLLGIVWTPFDGGWTFEVVDCTLKDLAHLFVGNIGATCNKYRGTLVNGYSDDKSAIVLRPYDCDNGMNPIFARYDRNFTGRRFGLTAGPRAEVLAALKTMTVVSGMPINRCGGAWALESDLARTSYLQPVMETDHVDDWIDLARRGGFGVIHFRRWMQSYGEYHAKTNLCPRGDADLYAASRRIHAAGLKSGIHTLTGCISPHDAWTATPLNTNLMAWATYTLAEPLSADAKELVVNEMPIARHDTVFSYSGNGNAIRIGTEIVQYTGIVREKPYRFTGLTRGAFGTTKAVHDAGDEAAYLQQRYMAFYPHPDSPLADKLAERMADFFNRGGFDMIYFDGSEGMALGAEKFTAEMRTKLFRRLGGSAIVEASCTEPQCWWYRTRLGSFDNTCWDAKDFFDIHLRYESGARKADFLETTMGWWCVHDWTGAFRGQRADELEYFMLKNAANDYGMSISGLDINRKPLSHYRSDMFTRLGWYEHFRLARAFSTETRARLAPYGAEFRLGQDDAGRWMFTPFETRAQRLNAGESAHMEFTSSRTARLRVDAQPTAAAFDAPGYGVCFKPDDVATLASTNAPGTTLAVEQSRDEAHGATLVLSASNATAPASGSWAGVRRTYSPHLSVNNMHELWVKGDGSGAILDVRFVGAREYGLFVADHIIRLDFTGWKLVKLARAERDAGKASSYTWPSKVHFYSRFHRSGDLRHIQHLDFLLNDIPAGAKAHVEIGELRTRGMVVADILHPVVTLNGQSETLPFAMKSWDFAERMDGYWMHYDCRGNLLHRAPATSTLSLKAGVNEISFTADAPKVGDARVEVTVFGDDQPFPALRDDVESPHMTYEGALSIAYAPQKGADGKTLVRTRPNRRAKLEMTVYGPITRPSVAVAGVTRTFDITLAANDKYKIDWQPEIAGVAEITLTGSGASDDGRLELAKIYEK